MTTDKTPTPEELEALARKHGATSYRNRADTQHPAYGFTEDGLRSLLADALAKWGQPAQATEPVAWLDPWTGTKVTTDYDAYGKHGIPLYAAPQPVAQEPLDEARRLFDAGWKAAALFCDREDVVADGIIGFGACPQFEAAFSAANGIKGGQHGTE